MTDKQEKILKAALDLFANEGYNATSTSKIAKHAGVSEGLIFRHFKNKQGLLDAVIRQGEERAKVVFSDIVFESDPVKVIEKTFLLNETMLGNVAEARFWKLQYKIKWEIERYGEHKMEALEMALSNAFNKLGYEHPELEAKHFLVTMDGLATRFYLQKSFDMEEILEYMKKRYLK